ncbi:MULTISPECIES: IucA/IucC family C-terminal-domain containing protein [unclassified Paenibacillus]|uniref:IucA/IucC family C-terminal-domain containing protein n=1 Tax=unclassified Paenibacillus TaxID=185978 RepID=UPI002406989D|nr:MULTISPECIES: IucA/IucC family C-terminal-domain containing protein [unclassified Paenibacillus]MDF9841484.1 ferric iron reductase protein FhuF [Paenibacillus sp. PastF-2]MDF9848073.1 ferric iron reductase protein FhuF [Paenibacillus sp. PastM-2]MDF9854642.1 ferric iron reductase protein FhuF [Paenibacillus sp. PastF-1]MDH6479750.1 ferric iron reductase protein FhuF [Paenibacillus sp. PastH-2]MDH6507348.1 ferric iron reductase protein FhuF [Paenibacillus sp. PastM-3]
MDSYLSSASWKQLTADYRIWPGEPPASSIRTIALSHLHDEAACRDYISWFRDYIGAPDTQVAASMLAKRIGYLWIAPLLTAITFHNREVSIVLDKSYLYHKDMSAGQGDTRFPFLALEGLRTAAAPLDNRTVWREGVVKQIFAEHLAPLLQILAAVGPVSMAVLWENIMVRIAPLYAPGTAESGQEQQRMSEDFTYLTKTAPGSLFGMRRNPLTRFTEQHDGIQVAKSKRITCCFYYRMSGEYCLKCPKIDNENESQLK